MSNVFHAYILTTKGVFGNQFNSTALKQHEGRLWTALKQHEGRFTQSNFWSKLFLKFKKKKILFSEWRINLQSFSHLSVQTYIPRRVSHPSFVMEVFQYRMEIL